MKKKLIITCGVLLLILGGLIVAPNLIDWNDYKPMVADAFESATGQTVKLDGDLSFKLLPSPALSASNVSLANVPGGQAANFLEMDALDLRVELWPLFSGDFKVTSLVVDGGKIHLERDLEGAANWETLFQSAETEPAPEKQREVVLESFILRNTEVTYDDASTRFHEAVSKINADLNISSLTGPVNGKGDLVYHAIPIDFTLATGQFSEGANVPVRLDLVLDGDDPGLSFQGTYVEEEGIVALSGNLSAGGDDASTLIDLAEAAGGMEQPPEGPWEQNYKAETSILMVTTPEKTDVVLDSLSLTLGQTTATGKTQLLIADNFEIKSDLDIDRVKAEDWTGGEDSNQPFEMPEDIKASLTLDIGTISYRGGNIENVSLKGGLTEGKFAIETLNATLPGRADLMVSGSLTAKSGQPVMDAKVHIDARTLRDLLGWLDIDVSSYPKNRVTRLTFDGRVLYADPAVEIMGATATLDSTRFSGGMTLDLDDSTHFAVAGTVNDIDLDAYFPDLLEKAEYANFSDQFKGWQEALKGLTGYTAIIDLKLDRLKMMGANLRTIAFKGALTGDDIAITTLTVASFEGAGLSLSGTVKDIPDTFSYDLTTTVSANNFQPFLSWADMESPFEERVVPSGSIQAAFKGTGSAGTFSTSGILSGIEFRLAGTANALKTKPVIAADLRLYHERMIEFVRKFSPEYFPAKTPLGVFNLTARLEGGEGDLTFKDLALQLGPARFQGALTYRTLNERPTITGEISGQTMTLDDFMAPAEAGITEVAGGEGERWSSDVWDLEFLRSTDFDVKFSLNSLAFRTYRFLNPTVRLKAANGVMTIDNMTAGFFGGTITVNGTMNAAATPVIKVDVALKGVSTRDVLKSSSDISNLTGTMDFTGAFTGTGDSQKAVIATLAGNAELATRNGVIKGIDMPKLSEQMGALDSLIAFKSLLGTVFKGGETPYRYILAKPAVKAGVISFNQVESDVDATEIGGRGKIDLPRWQMDVSGALRLKDHADVPAIGVNMTGRVDTPSVRYDYAALTAHMTEKFTSTLFQQLLKKPKTEGEGQPLPQGQEQPAQNPPAEGDQPTAEPSPEEQILKGLFDLLGGQQEDETPAEDDDDGGGGGGL